MMEEHQILDAHFLSDPHALEPRRMPPALARGGELLGSKLRVVYKNIGALGQLAQRPVQLGVARLVVRGVRDRARGSLKAEAQAALRMVQPARRHTRARHADRVSPAHFGKVAFGAHRRQVHRKIGIRHLRFKDALQAAGAEILGPETVKVKAVMFRVQGRKKRDALNVVPVVVGHENMRLVLLRFLRGFQMPPQHAQPGPIILPHRSPRRCPRRRTTRPLPHRAHLFCAAPAVQPARRRRRLARARGQRRAARRQRQPVRRDPRSGLHLRGPPA